MIICSVKSKNKFYLYIPRRTQKQKDTSATVVIHNRPTAENMTKKKEKKKPSYPIVINLQYII